MKKSRIATPTREIMTGVPNLFRDPAVDSTPPNRASRRGIWPHAREIHRRQVSTRLFGYFAHANYCVIFDPGVCIFKQARSGMSAAVEWDWRSPIARPIAFRRF